MALHVDVVELGLRVQVNGCITKIPRFPEGNRLLLCSVTRSKFKVF